MLARRVIHGLGLSVLVCGLTSHASAPLRKLSVDASASAGRIRCLQGVDGVPVGAIGDTHLGILDGPDLRAQWREAHVKLVRSYIWQSRLDTIDNPGSLFPHWAADPNQAASYNFKTTDALVQAARDVGADVIFTLTSSIPRNKLPPGDLPKYGQVVKRIVQHYTQGWADGMTDAIRYWEIGDEPDLSGYHFDGTPQQFYDVYDTAARAVKSVDQSLRVGGPAIAFPLNTGPFREGFLQEVVRRSMPFDFLSWKWYSDTSADPLDIVRVSRETTAQLKAAGLGNARQMVTNWNYAAIPTARPDRLRMGVYETAALTYMQDTAVTGATLFRGDAATNTLRDPDADLTTRMFNPDGTPMKNAYGFRAAGRMQDTPERLPVSGGDDKGFAVLAGKSERGDAIQVLITNYAIPAANLIPGKDILEFDLPVPGKPVHVTWKQLTRRSDAVQNNNGGYDLTVTKLPWGRGGYTVQRFRLDAEHDLTLAGESAGKGSRVRVASSLPEPSVELVVIKRAAASVGAAR